MMLYDPNWKAPEVISLIPLAVKMEPPWRQILLDAADLIEKYGWVQGRLGRPDTGFCAIGSIQAVNFCGGMGMAFNKVWFAINKGDIGLGISIGTWNDHPTRTKEQVVAKLREVAHAV